MQATTVNSSEPSKPRGEKLCSEIGVSGEHSENMEKISSYMEEHRLPELFNEILTRILDERPENAKHHIIGYLESVKKMDTKDPFCQKVYQFQDEKNGIDNYLVQEDFESVFDSYDVLGIQSVPISYLCQALTVVGVENAQEILMTRYPELCKEE